MTGSDSERKQTAPDDSSEAAHPDPGKAAEPVDPGKAAEPDEQDFVKDLGPDVPEVDIPQPPDFSGNDVPDELARSFWKLVMVFNLALFALALGPMLIFFRGEWTNGTAVFALGLAAFVYGYRRYQRVTSDDHNR